MGKIADSLNNFWNIAVKPIKTTLTSHAGSSDIHVTAAQKTTWNNKQTALTFDNTPTVGSANPVTSGGVKNAIDSAAGQSSGPIHYTFSANDWSGGTLTISAATHGFTGSEILYNFYHLISGSYTPGTWACVESWAEINASTHVITLYGPSKGYAGKVVLFG